jgi:hypothetical protein
MVFKYHFLFTRSYTLMQWILNPLTLKLTVSCLCSTDIKLGFKALELSHISFFILLHLYMKASACIFHDDTFHCYFSKDKIMNSNPICPTRSSKKRHIMFMLQSWGKARSHRLCKAVKICLTTVYIQIDLKVLSFIF